MSNWCQNRKNHNFKRNKILQTIDFKGFAKKSQKISTHLLFTSFVLEDIRCMIKRHHELYSYISEIRTCEINDAAEQKALNMTSEEENNMQL